MFFRRTKSTTASSAQLQNDRSNNANGNSEAEVAMVLDSLGRVLASYVNELFDMTDQPASEAKVQLEAWRRHALLGSAPPDDQIIGLPTRHGVSLAERDWDGVSEAFGKHRRHEKEFVETAITDLRDALWVCVEQAQGAIAEEETASAASVEYKKRLRSALDRLETGVVKDQITHAMRCLEQITERRQQAQQKIYAQLAERISELDTQLEETRRASETDSLTGLGNRLHFNKSITRQVQVHGISGGPLVLVLLDLDRLKSINDMCGHQAGDTALATVAKVLHRVFMREADIICRIGGDEFAVLLPTTTHGLALRLAERLTAAISDEPWPYGDSGLSLSISVGLALWERGESIESLISRADKELYSNKTARHTT